MAREIAIAGAASLAAIYNPRAEVIPMGAEFEEVQSVGMTESEVDVVQIAALIAWAGRETGDVRLAEIAIKHPRRHIEFCIREDGSICQSASFDPASGEVTRRYTHKGISDDSTWARAQAWGMLGWALAAQWTGDSSLLEPVERAAEWWLGHVPADLVAFWDFDDPAIPKTNRDTSATAIAAAAMIKIAALTGSNSKRRRYNEAAGATVRALVGKYLGEDGGFGGGLLQQTDRSSTEERTDLGIVLFVRGAQVLAGLLEPTKV
jgi:unsaturated chondroitin disaccharide hydrolase